MKKIKNVLLNTLFKTLAKCKSRKLPNTSKVLVVSTTGIGDTIWATPAIDYLANTYHCQIDVLTSSIGFQVLKNNPNIQKMICFRSNIGRIISLIKYMMSTPYAHVFAFHSSQRIVPYIAYLGNPRSYYGINVLSSKMTNLFTKLLVTKDYPNTHQIEWRLMLVQYVYPNKDITFKPKLSMYLSESEEQQAQQFFVDHKIKSREFVFVNPGASRKKRQWHPDYFKEVVIFLSEKLNKKVIVSGGPKEIDLIKYIVDGLNDNVIPIFGNLSLRVVSAIISHAEFMLTNDTGPMHIAEIFQIPMITNVLDENYSSSRPILSNAYTKVIAVKEQVKNEYITSLPVALVVGYLEDYFMS